MCKSNKELAVDVTLAYISGVFNDRQAIISAKTNIINADMIASLIKTTYKTLESIDSSNVETSTSDLVKAVIGTP